MLTVTIHEAKTNLSKLIAAAVAGEPFVIAKAGKPLVKVSAVEARGDAPAERPAKRHLGFLAGQIDIPDDFDTMFQDEIEEMFYGNPDKLT